jgi:hypothetical protein
VLTIDAGLLSDTAIQGTNIIVLEFCFDMLRYSMKKKKKLSVDYTVQCKTFHRLYVGSL